MNSIVALRQISKYAQLRRVTPPEFLENRICLLNSIRRMDSNFNGAELFQNVTSVKLTLDIDFIMKVVSLRLEMFWIDVLIMLSSK